MQAKMYNLSIWTTATEPDGLIKLLNNYLKYSEFEVLAMTRHDFQPYGMTALWLLSESHLAVHTFPERGKSYIELTSCVKPQYETFRLLVSSMANAEPDND